MSATACSHTLSIQSSVRTYSIYLGQGVLHSVFPYLFESLNAQKVFFVIDSNVASYSQYTDFFSSHYAGREIQIKTLPSGETTKSLPYVDQIYDWLLSHNADRHSVVCAVGGGVIGDCVGFVAATYMRGVRFVQIPTTLLSMVDSSIGGKVGINHVRGKNMIGAFYPPHAVFIDVAFLDTLPVREFNAGLAECIKHGLIDSDELFSWYNNNKDEIINKDVSVLIELIFKNLKVKAEIVEKDEKEENIRAFLNFGHTFAHAIEKSFGYDGRIIHGEAVSLGMHAALILSHSVLGLDSNIIDSYIQVSKHFSLPTHFNDLPPFEELLDAMKKDKKNKDGLISFVLLNSIGSPRVVSSVDVDTVREAYRHIAAKTS